MEWKLREGGIYDDFYLNKYLEVNRDFLPAAFTRESVQMATDCPHALVDLKMIVDPAEDKSAPPKDVPCESAKDNQK